MLRSFSHIPKKIAKNPEYLKKTIQVKSLSLPLPIQVHIEKDDYDLLACEHLLPPKKTTINPTPHG